ncbi:MAG: hypothetical protein U1E27_08860, partial [Kiritimatiellia bacterium]|nr:hypothetical protein [Kiritimatiellia bacterium]
RIEEVTPAPRFAGQPLDAILPAGPDQALLVALKHGSDWVFNPPRARRLDQGETLIVMIAATELPALRDRLGDRAAGR